MVLLFGSCLPFSHTFCWRENKQPCNDRCCRAAMWCMRHLSPEAAKYTVVASPYKHIRCYQRFANHQHTLLILIKPAIDFTDKTSPILS